jgi:hypothetical protein
LAYNRSADEHLMADQSDVETELVGFVFSALYPGGTGSSSVPGPVCRIYRGWPKAAALNADLAAGRINVTVFPAGSAMRNTTRYPSEWTTTESAPTLTVAVAGSVVTFGGSASSAQLAGVRVDGRSYAYRTTATDTPSSVAANIATLARADGAVVQSYATLTFENAGEVLPRVVADASGLMEVRRQTQGFRVICWCPSPSLRDTVAVAIDTVLATVRFITMPDGTAARLIFSGSTVLDQSQDAILYRRDLTYAVEYATTITAVQPSMLFGSLGLNAANFIA